MTEPIPAPDADADADAEGVVDIDAFVEAESAPAPRRRIDRPVLVAFAVLPALAMLLAILAGYLRWQASSMSSSRIAEIESVAAARDAAIAMLSYAPGTAEKDLMGARDRLTGTFLDSYTELIKGVVIPGAKEKNISSTAQVPAAGAVSAKPDHVVVLLFVDQSTTVGKDAPMNTTSSVRVTLDKAGERWLVSGFEPV